MSKPFTLELDAADALALAEAVYQASHETNAHADEARQVGDHELTGGFQRLSDRQLALYNRIVKLLQGTSA